VASGKSQSNYWSQDHCRTLNKAAQIVAFTHKNVQVNELVSEGWLRYARYYKTCSGSYHLRNLISTMIQYILLIQKKEEVDVDFSADTSPFHPADKSPAIAERVEAKLLYCCLDDIEKEEDREIMKMYIEEGLTKMEICRELDKPYMTVSSKITRTLNHIKEELDTES